MSEHPYLDRKLNAAFRKLEAEARKAAERLQSAGYTSLLTIDLEDGSKSQQFTRLSDDPVNLLVRGAGYDVSRVEYAALHCYLGSQGGLIGRDNYSAEPRHFLRSDGNTGSTHWRKISLETYRKAVNSKIERDDISVNGRFVKELTAPINELTKLCKQLRAPSVSHSQQ